MLQRPKPPAELFELTGAPSFLPSSELEHWARSTFIDEDATLANEEHSHLRFASIGFLWASVPNSRHGRAIAGTCEMMPPAVMGRWPRERAIQQIEAWFGAMPDFLITIDARAGDQIDDASFCALVEHELLHAGQERDEFGAPKFRKSGLPAFTMRGHDVQEFVTVVRRYGVGLQVGGDVLQLVQAAANGPEIASASIARACGNCMLRAA